MSGLTSLEIGTLFVGMGLVTLGTRSFFMFWGDRVRMPELILRSIRYAPLAAIVAILAPEILMPFGATQISQFNWATPQIWAGLAAFVLLFPLSYQFCSRDGIRWFDGNSGTKR